LLAFESLRFNRQSIRPQGECPITTIKTSHRSIVSLKLPRAPAALTALATGIVKAMSGNPVFATPTPPLSSVTQAITDLNTAETTALTRAKGAVTLRNEKVTALVALLQQLKAYVQAVADANVENGASIIESAALDVRKTPVRKPRVFAALPGTVSGSAKLVAPSAGPRSSYEWVYSTDGGKTWTTAPVTLQAKTAVTGLTPGATVQFRYRPVTKVGEGDWSQTVVLLVK
jgi:hypothetical protein